MIALDYLDDLDVICKNPIFCNQSMHNWLKAVHVGLDICWHVVVPKTLSYAAPQTSPLCLASFR